MLAFKRFQTLSNAFRCFGNSSQERGGSGQLELPESKCLVIGETTKFSFLIRLGSASDLEHAKTFRFQQSAEINAILHLS